MNKNILTLGIIGLIGYVIYKSSKKKSVITEVEVKNFTDEIPAHPHSLEKLTPEHITQEEQATTNIHIDPVLPDFVKPELLEEHFKNYVDVQKNEYFKPQVSAFFK